MEPKNEGPESVAADRAVGLTSEAEQVDDSTALESLCIEDQIAIVRRQHDLEIEALETIFAGAKENFTSREELVPHRLIDDAARCLSRKTALYAFVLWLEAQQ